MILSLKPELTFCKKQGALHVSSRRNLSDMYVVDYLNDEELGD